MPIIKLQSSDGEIIEVEDRIAKESIVLKEMMEFCGEDETVIPLTKFNSIILKKIFEWIRYHINDPPPTENDRHNKDISSWDTNFFKVDDDTLKELIEAANYLNVPGLLDAACKMIANTMINGKTSDQIRERFGLEKEDST